MKNLKRIIVAFVVMLTVAASASAQFRWGVKVGADINKMKFNESVLASDNRAGFTGGIITEFTVPLIGIGMDASVMYTHKNNKVYGTEAGSFNTDFIEIPLNLKYKFGIPAIGNIVCPYVITGPSFGFLVSKKTIENVYHHKSCDVSWNVGAGVQLLNHLQISAQYGFGINKAVEAIGMTTQDIEAKNNTWTITAAYLF